MKRFVKLTMREFSMRGFFKKKEVSRMPWHVDVDSIESVLLMEGDALIMLKSNNAYFVVESPEEVLTKISAAQAACRAQEK